MNRDEVIMANLCVDYDEALGTRFLIIIPYNGSLIGLDEEQYDLKDNLPLRYEGYC